MNYWSKKDELKEKAYKHYQLMVDNYEDEIKDINVKLYNKIKENDNDKKPNFFIKAKDTVSAAFEYKKACILDFASYTNPGGKFLNGSSAQEESLCHESYLYNILENQGEYFAYNNAHKNKGMYENRLLYCKDVRFFRGNKTNKYDVIVCASPNKSVSVKYGNFTDEENDKALEQRIKLIKTSAEDNNVDTLILGAFGCGVFMQDPNIVSNLFFDIFEKTTVKNIVFALLKDKNFDVFINNMKKRNLL